jgi:hypothetical protein
MDFMCLPVDVYTASLEGNNTMFFIFILACSSLKSEKIPIILPLNHAQATLLVTSVPLISSVWLLHPAKKSRRFLSLLLFGIH